MTSAIITSELIRAARALLRWEQRQLAEASSVSLPTVKRLEAKAGSLAAHASTVAALVKALEAAGIEFTNGERPGVRLSAGTAAGIAQTNVAKARKT
jgi:transcriptional regulator with XRE-family HTH domain